MIVRYRVTEQLPLPARYISNVVQLALKIKKPAADKLIHDGFVRLRGRALMQSHLRVDAGDEIEIDYVPQPVKTVGKATSTRTTFEVMHDDEHIIVVNKPAKLLTVPTPKREGNTLQSQVRKWLERQKKDSKAICVHRLDRGVSGVLVFAKSFESADAIRAQFAERKPHRIYTAILAGEMRKNGGTIRSYLSTDDSLNRISSNDPNAGELAITHFEVKEIWRGATLVQVQLETGRRNQIRVHMADAGHPIIGDPRYKARQAAHELWDDKRIALHAETLGILHPATGQELMFRAPWPQEFRDMRRALYRE